MSLDQLQFYRALEQAECVPGSPLIACPTPSRVSMTSIATEATAATSSTIAGMSQHVHVIVRVKPPEDEEQHCLDWAGNKICMQIPDNDDDPQLKEPRTPGRGPVPSAPLTPGRNTRAPRTPGSAMKTPSRGAGCRTPGAHTPGRPRSAVPKTFHFDAVYGRDSSQSEVFSHALPLIDAALRGSNSCIFAYGQTGTGKTYTMMGSSNEPGIVPRAVDRIWQRISQSKNTEWQVYLTYAELYNDGFRDLLCSTSQPGQRLLVSQQEDTRRAQSGITLRETKSTRGGPPSACLTGSATFHSRVNNKSEFLHLLAMGHAARSTAATDANQRSSRSHAVITINIDSREAGGPLRSGKLNLVDLAGSESLCSQAERELKAETKAINVSLTALCDVLQALSKNARRQPGAAANPIPFRNHKLTRLLADSLGGDSQTLMIATVQAGLEHYRSTVTTLKFASRARDISIHGVIGETVRTTTTEQPMDARVLELQERLARREAEIQALETIVRGREAQLRSEHEETLIEVKEAHAQELTAVKSQLLLQSEERSLATAEFAHSAAALEMEAAAREHEMRKAQLDVLQLRYQLEDAKADFQQMQDELHRANTENDELSAECARDRTALAQALSDWKADRETLAALQAELKVNRDTAKREDVQDKEREEAAARLELLEKSERAQQELVRATHVAAEGYREMMTVQSLLAVLKDDPSVVASSAASTLKWLQGKLDEGVRRYQQAVDPFADVLAAEKKLESKATRGGRRRTLVESQTEPESVQPKRSKSNRLSSKAQCADVIMEDSPTVPKKSVPEEIPTDHSEVPMSIASVASAPTAKGIESFNMSPINEVPEPIPRVETAPKEDKAAGSRRSRTSKLKECKVLAMTPSQAASDVSCNSERNSDTHRDSEHVLQQPTRASRSRSSTTEGMSRPNYAESTEDVPDPRQKSKRSRRTAPDGGKTCSSGTYTEAGSENEVGKNPSGRATRRTRGLDKVIEQPKSPLQQLGAAAAIPSSAQSKRKLFNPHSNTARSMLEQLPISSL